MPSPPPVTVEFFGVEPLRTRLVLRTPEEFNDYLGLAAHPDVVRAFIDAANTHGVGSGASHLVTGHGLEHEALEEELAVFTGREKALVFSTGTNQWDWGLSNTTAGSGEPNAQIRQATTKLIEAAESA